MTGPKFHSLFGGPPRDAESKITQREMDLAASLQAVTEEIMLRIARHVHAQTGMKDLCLAGGVALNCVGNGRILREGPFERIWVQPAAGDAGGALGAALFTHYHLLRTSRTPQPGDQQSGSLLGPRYSDAQIERYLASVGAKWTRFNADDLLCAAVAEHIAAGRVVGWFCGRMEFGPRALGARSIIGDARSETMQALMNLKIKFRESFRPFAPSVLRGRVHEYFDMRPGEESPYMLLVAPVANSKRIELNGQADGLFGIERLKLPRSVIPAITHVDCSARVQTVDADRHGRFHSLLSAFERLTDCPVVINTSFNVRGEPIVCTPQDAYRCFMATNIDVLVLERCVLMKSEQPAASDADIDRHLSQFKLD